MYGFFRIIFGFLVMMFTVSSVSFSAVLRTVTAQDCVHQEAPFCLYEFKLVLNATVDLVAKDTKKIKGVVIEQFFLPGAQFSPTLDLSHVHYTYSARVGYGFSIKNIQEGLLIVVTYNPDLIIFHYDLPIESQNCLDTVIMFYFYDKKIKDAIEQKSNPIISLAYNNGIKKTAVV